MKEKTIKVVLCEPGEYAKTAEIVNTLEGLQRAVGGCIEAFYPFEEPVCIVCNDEGKFNGMEPNRAVYGENNELLDVIFGPFMICSCRGEDFGSLDREQLERYGKLFRRPDCLVRVNGKLLAIPYDPQDEGPEES